jgi:NAD-dependent dihydropyrimidine dehydrogenase PreA subunit
MPYIITEYCIDVMDGACREVCPVNCIYLPEETKLPKAKHNNARALINFLKGE